MPSRDFTSEDLFSSRMMSMQSSTHSSQMKTVGPAISFLTSCWLLPQNEQYKVFLESVLPTLLIPFSVSLVPIPDQANRSKQTDKSSARQSIARCVTPLLVQSRTDLISEANSAPEFQHGGHSILGGR